MYEEDVIDQLNWQTLTDTTVNDQSTAHPLITIWARHTCQSHGRHAQSSNPYSSSPETLRSNLQRTTSVISPGRVHFPTCTYRNHGEERYRTPSDFEVHRHQGQRSKAKGKVWIRDQARSRRLGYPKLLAVNADVNRRPG